MIDIKRLEALVEQARNTSTDIGVWNQIITEGYPEVAFTNSPIADAFTTGWEDPVWLAQKYNELAGKHALGYIRRECDKDGNPL